MMIQQCCCSHCSQQYNKEIRMPRILVKCGHTFCQECIVESIVAGSQDLVLHTCDSVELECFECRTVASLELDHEGGEADPDNDKIVALSIEKNLPKNFMLLQVIDAVSQAGQTISKEPTEEKINSDSDSNFQNEHGEIVNIGAESITAEEEVQSFCTVDGHQGKRLEAFCERDSELLCIDCILGKHKGHEFKAIAKAAEKHRTFLRNELSESQQSAQKLHSVNNDIDSFVVRMREQAEYNKLNIGKLYQKMHEVLNEREINVKKTVTETLEREEAILELKKKTVVGAIETITNFTGFIDGFEAQSDIVLLQEIDRNNKAISEIMQGQSIEELVTLQSTKKDMLFMSTQEVKCDNEQIFLTKVLNPNYKGTLTSSQNLFAQSSEPNKSSHLYSHTASSTMKSRKTQEEEKQKDRMSRQTSELKSSMTFTNQLASHIRQSIKMTTNSQSLASPRATPPTIVQNGIENQTKRRGTFQDRQGPSNQIQNNQIQRQVTTTSKKTHHQNALSTSKPTNFQSSKPGATSTTAAHLGEKTPVQNSGGTNSQSTTPSNNTKRSYVKPTGVANKFTKQQQAPLNGALLTKDGAKFTPSLNSFAASQPSSLIAPAIINKQNMGQESQRQKSKSTYGGTASTMRTQSNLRPRGGGGALLNSSPKNGQIQRLRSPDGRKTSNMKDDVAKVQAQVNRVIEEIGNNEMPYDKMNYLRKSSEKNKLAEIMEFKQRMSSPKSPNIKKHSREEHNSSDLIHDVSNEYLVGTISPTKNTKTMTDSVNKPEVDVTNISEKENSNGEQLCASADLGSVINPQDMGMNTVKPFQNFAIEMEYDEIFRRKEDEIQTIEPQTALLEEVKKEEKKAKERPDYNQSLVSDLDQLLRDLQESDNPPYAGQRQSNSSGNSFKEKARSPTGRSPTLPTAHLVDTVEDQSSATTLSIDPFRALCQLREEYIFAFSGFNDRKLTKCEVYDTARGEWHEIASMQAARTKFSALAISKSRILVFGGKQADGCRTGDIEEFNLKKNTFQRLPFKMPKARSGFAACVKRDESKIFFCGGNSGNSGTNATGSGDHKSATAGNILKKFDMLDLKKGRWTRLPDMQQKRDELQCALGPDNMIYAVGGFGGSADGAASASSCLATVERFDFTTTSWQMLPSMRQARRALAVVALPDGIYAIGGYDGKQYLATVEKFDLATQAWLTVRSMNTARCTLAAVASNDCRFIYVLGGYNGSALNLVERYSVETDSWEYVAPMVTKRFMHQAVALLSSHPSTALFSAGSKETSPPSVEIDRIQQ